MIQYYVQSVNDFFTSKGMAIRGVPIQALLGEDHVAYNTDSIRVVVYPTSEEIAPGLQAGGRDPRAIYTRVVGLEWEVWGGDYIETEALIQCVLHAVHFHGRGYSDAVQGIEWDRETKELQYGRKAYVRTAFHVPITDRKYGASYPFTALGAFDPGATPVMDDPLDFETTLIELDQSAVISGRFRTP